MFRLLLCLLVLIGVTGCREISPPPESAGEIRIASLSPAITRAIEDLGLADSLVGRSTWCQLDSLDIDSIPAVGDLHDRDWERLVRPGPTHVLFQASDVETDAMLQDLAARHGWLLHAWPLRTMGEVCNMLDDMSGLFTQAEHADEIRIRCNQRSDEIKASIKPPTRELDVQVLMVSDGQPSLAWGESTYLGEMLASTGAANVMGASAWKTISLEDIVRMNPDVILVVSESEAGDQSFLDGLDLQAIRDNQLHHLSHRYINLPGAHLASLAHQIQSAVID